MHAVRSQQGFALLLTLVVVSVIGVVAFGVGRLTLSQFRQGIRFEDSQDALQVAEAGIEDGLVRFRYDRNTQVPMQATCASTGAQITLASGDAAVPDPTDETNYVLRVNLTTGKLQCLNPRANIPSPSPDEHVYDLKIFYKAKSLDPNTSPVVAKDSTYEIGAINNSDSNLVITAKDILNSDQCTKQSNPQNAYLQIEYFGANGSPSIPPVIIKEGSFQHRQLKGGGLPSAVAGTSTVELKPLENCIQIGGELSGSLPIDFGTTIIQSTGYFNGVKRTLYSYVNRSTGTTHGIYNYVIFSPNTVTQTP